MKRLFTLLALLIFISSPAFATVSDTASPVKIYSSGTATSYPITFDYIDDEDVVVTLVNATTGVETAQTIDVDYTITSSTVTYSVAPGAAYKVVLRRSTPYTQEASFSPGTAPPLTTYESAYDKLTMLVQDLDERMRRAFLLPEASTTTDVEWPDLALNAGKLVRINTDGDGLEAISTVAAGYALDVTAYCDAADLTKLHELMDVAGYVQRPVFNVTDADTITIGPGVYDHRGTTNQVVYWDSTLTKDLTVSGTRWYYLYIDDSAIVSAGTNELTALAFVASTTGPTYSSSKHGWYNGNDRCITAFHVTSGSLDYIAHDGGDYLQYASGIEDLTTADITGTAEISMTVPSFCTGVMCYFYSNLNSGYTLHTSPSSGLGPKVLTGIASTDVTETARVMCSSSQKLYIGLSNYTGTNNVAITTNGWFFPAGM